MTTGAIRSAKLQSKFVTNFLQTDAVPVAQPSVRALKGRDFNFNDFSVIKILRTITVGLITLR